jgi:hypothetical protein
VKRTKLIIFGITAVVLSVLATSIAWAAFSDKSLIGASTFSVGNSDLKLLSNVSMGSETGNQADQLAGPIFTNISPNWQQDYLLKLYNNGTTPLQVASNANYETDNDPAELRSVIFVEPFIWSDNNGDGEVGSDELGVSLGKKTITKWKTEGYDFGRLETMQVQGFVLRFSTESLSNTKMGAEGLFDFEFDAVSVN